MGETMSDALIDLDAYFARIGYEGARTPTLETLKGIQLAHAMSIPFENLNILFGKGVQLDQATLTSKIVNQAHGGYCFEQNGLALAVLQQLGFEATGLIGRVRWMLEADAPSPQTHMLIRVELSGKTYIYDGGFGGIRMTGVLELVPDLVQPTAHEDHRIVQSGSNYTIQADLGETWADVVQFTMEPATSVDYELSSWFTSTHPDSLFVQNLIVERPGEGVRRMIFNESFIERLAGQEQTITPITSVDQMVSLLDEHFGLRVESSEQRAVLQKFIAAT
jgi:N-hydroxyarylamine O-acetyltransferase